MKHEKTHQERNGNTMIPNKSKVEGAGLHSERNIYSFMIDLTEKIFRDYCTIEIYFIHLSSIY